MLQYENSDPENPLPLKSSVADFPSRSLSVIFRAGPGYTVSSAVRVLGTVHYY